MSTSNLVPTPTVALAPKPTTPKGKARTRSPAYPSIPLKPAIERARAVYQHEKRNVAYLGTIAADWGLNPKSSSFSLAISALKKYDLLEEVEGGKERQLKLTQTALSILLHEDDAPERIALLKHCALAPKIHAQLWKFYNGELPSDSNLKRHLILELSFNDAMVDGFIKDFRDTIAFAKLSSSDKITAVVSDDVEDAEQAKDVSETPTPEIPASKPMNQPSVAPASTAVLREFAFPLSSGMAFLRVPFPMAEDDFEFFLATLGLWKKKLIKPSRQFPTVAVWKNADFDKTIVIMREMGQKDGERYFQSEDGTGIPESQLTFPN